MNANQFLHYQLFIKQTRDAFILKAKSFSAARDEAKNILAGKEFTTSRTARQMIALVKSCEISTYTSRFENPAFLEEKDKHNTKKLQ